jgi:glycerophosphoryl diester phosphodiesterase
MDKMSTDVNWISHRGVTTRAIENTRLAFEDAVAAGFQTLETDLHTTSDGIIVLSHDDNLSHVMNLDRNISETTYNELKELPLPDGQTILSFDEFVDVFSDKQWILDIKPENAYSVIDVLEVMARDEDFRGVLLRQVRVLCWSWRVQRYCQARLPGVKFLPREIECYRAVLACLCRIPWLGGITAGKSYPVPPEFRGFTLLNSRLIHEFHRRGAGVIAYRPTTEDEISAALALGVDEVILDFAYDGMGGTARAK